MIGTRSYSARGRAVIALLAGAWGGILSFAFASRPGFYGDHLAWWFGARVLLAGGNPYATLPSGAPWHITDPLFYPVTALLATIPVAGLSLAVSQGVFFGLGSAALGWGLAGERPHRLLILLSYPFIIAANLGQWSPWIAAAMLVPALGWMVAVKPNLGIAAVAWRPSRALIIGGAAFAILSLLVRPTWPMEWLASVRTGHSHPAPLRTLLGLPILLALSQWRSRDARLVLAMAVLPQTALFADQLLLLLVPKTKKEIYFMLFAGFAGAYFFSEHLRSTSDPRALLDMRYVIVSVYWPAVAVLLARALAGSAAEPDQAFARQARAGDVTPATAATSAASPTAPDYTGRA